MCGQNCARALSFTDRCVHGVQTRMRQQPPWNCVLHLTRKAISPVCSFSSSSELYYNILLFLRHEQSQQPSFSCFHNISISTPKKIKNRLISCKGWLLRPNFKKRVGGKPKNLHSGDYRLFFLIHPGCVT